MKTIERLENKITELRQELKLTTNPERKLELEEKIEAAQDKLEELEDAERDQDEWEEMTGTRPQDLYNERNSYAIRQGEMIERFRNEY